jgi:hypothetical protein
MNNNDNFNPIVLNNNNNNNNNNKEIQACLRQIPEMQEIPVNNLADGNPRYTPSADIFQGTENVPPPPPPVSSSSTLNTVSTNAKKTRPRRIETKSLSEYQGNLNNIVKNKELIEQCRLEPLNKLKKLENKEQIINPGKFDDIEGVKSRLKYYDDKLFKLNAQQKVVEDIIQKLLNPQNNNEMNNSKSSIFKNMYRKLTRGKKQGAYKGLSPEQKMKHNERQREYRKKLTPEQIAHRNQVRIKSRQQKEQLARRRNLKGGITKKGKSSRKKKLKNTKTKKNTKSKGTKNKNI